MQRLWMIWLAMAVATGFVHAQQSTTVTDILVPAAQSTQLQKMPAISANAPRLLNKVEALYPDEAREMNLNGNCVVSLIVDVQGNPQNAHILRCTNPVFEESSLDAVAKLRFSPATKQDGTPLLCKINIELDYRRANINNLFSYIHYGFNPPPGITSAAPSTDGIYMLTREDVSPAILNFADKGYGKAAFPRAGNSVCDILLTISAKGKPSDPQVTHCERPELEKLAVKSLLKSRFTPGSVNGKAVPMRASVHLKFGGNDAK
jgi:TonB family protein